LGSINHTLLSLEVLKSNNLKVLGIIFNGTENTETEQFILNYSGAKYLGRIDEHQQITKEVVLSYKNKFSF
jgi:dethiobiotin synthetase